MKRKKKVGKKQRVVSRKIDNAFIRRVLLALGLASLAMFLYSIYKYVNNTSELLGSQNAVNEQIMLAGGLDQQYASLLNGNPNASTRLKSGMIEFDNSLRKIEMGEAGVMAPKEPQELVIKNIKSEWNVAKGLFNDTLSMGETASDVRTVAANVSSLLSDIKLSATRLNNNLANFNNVVRVSDELTGVVSTTESLDSMMQSILSQNKISATMSEKLDNQMAELSRLVNSVSKRLKASGAVAYNFPDRGNKELNALAGQLQSIRGTVTKLGGSLSKNLAAESASTDIVGPKSKLVTSLKKLKGSYVSDNAYPIKFLPLTYMHWVIFWLILTIILIGIWAIMLLRSGARLNKESTRLRIAAEERTKGDQEAILRLMDELADLSEGDLTIEAQVTEDFTGAIADSINFTVENMRDMVGTITHTSDEITRATNVSQDVSRLLAESSSEQSRQIDKSTETVSQMATSLHEIAENTDSSVAIARSSVDIAQEGRNRVQSTIKSMGDIRENIQETAKRIKRLGESSQEIGDIVEIIKGIADQTNVLALNAAIQATAAGEAGRGFAVVADEVQRLAERSANATKRIEVLVKTIQADANEAVASMENSTTQVVMGTDVAEEAGQSLDKIENVSKNLASLIVNVSTATRDAAGMAGSVADNMGRLAELNEKAVEDVTTSVKSVDDLLELSTSLKDSVAGFKLPG